MIRRSLGFVLLVCAASVVATAQKAPPAPQTEGKVFSFTFGGGDSYLGVQTENVSKENFARFGLREVRGVAVTKVLDDSPAAKAGIVANDVIVKFDGEEITGVRKLTRLISEVAPDHSVKITVLRNGQEIDLTATLEKRKFESFNGTFTMPNVVVPKVEMPEMPKVPMAITVPDGVWKTPGEGFTMFFGNGRQIGVAVTSLTKQLGDYFGVSEGKGLLITSVDANGPAAKAGLKAGDVIVEADGTPIANHMDLVRSLSEKKEGSVSLSIVRDKSRMTISVTPEPMKGGFAPFETPAPPKLAEPAKPMDMN